MVLNIMGCNLYIFMAPAEYGHLLKSGSLLQGISD